MMVVGIEVAAGVEVVEVVEVESMLCWARCAFGLRVQSFCAAHTTENHF